MPWKLPELIAALSAPDAYPHPAGAVEVQQTHISVVFLAGDFAYKIKKPVRMGFLDFHRLEQRKHFCAEEVRLNRRLAPHIYLGVVPILLGEGIPLFPSGFSQRNFTLIENKTFSRGLIALKYRRVRKAKKKS